MGNGARRRGGGRETGGRNTQEGLEGQDGKAQDGLIRDLLPRDAVRGARLGVRLGRPTGWGVREGVGDAGERGDEGSSVSAVKCKSPVPWTSLVLGAGVGWRMRRGAPGAPEAAGSEAKLSLSRSPNALSPSGRGAPVSGGLRRLNVSVAARRTFCRTPRPPAEPAWMISEVSEERSVSEASSW
jgi:hypothetical protein